MKLKGLVCKMNIKDLEKNIDYKEFSYPKEFIKILELNLIDFDVWYILSGDEFLNKLNGLKKRYPKRKLIPFAKRADNDDVACFEVGYNEGQVQLIHDFASEGFEQVSIYNNFWLWFKDAIDELIEFNKIELE